MDPKSDLKSLDAKELSFIDYLLDEVAGCGSGPYDQRELSRMTRNPRSVVSEKGCSLTGECMETVAVWDEGKDGEQCACAIHNEEEERSPDSAMLCPQSLSSESDGKTCGRNCNSLRCATYEHGCADALTGLKDVPCHATVDHESSSIAGENTSSSPLSSHGPPALDGPTPLYEGAKDTAPPQEDNEGTVAQHTAAASITSALSTDDASDSDFTPCPAWTEPLQLLQGESIYMNRHGED